MPTGLSLLCFPVPSLGTERASDQRLPLRRCHESRWPETRETASLQQERRISSAALGSPGEAKAGLLALDGRGAALWSPAEAKAGLLVLDGWGAALRSPGEAKAGLLVLDGWSASTREPRRGQGQAPGAGWLER